MPDTSPPPPRPGTPPDFGALLPAFQQLCEIIALLRSPDGCPWDREQTLESIKPCTLEETYELLEAIDAGDDAAIVEELGDLLLQIILDAQIGADSGRFELTAVVQGLIDKLIARHPHVFGEVRASNAREVKRRWDQAKQREKRRASLLDGLPPDLPQLARAARLSEKAASVGYDFPDRTMLFDKLREELHELADELFEEGKLPTLAASVDIEVQPDHPIEDPATRDRVEQEIGDMLFVVANIARRWHVDPEEALRRSNRKFDRRFRYIEQQLCAQGRDIRQATLREMEDLYQQGKQLERDTT